MIALRNPTGRNTPAHEVDIGPHRLYFSYETLIGYDGPLGAVRRENVWGPTTGRHINEMGIRNNEVVPPSELDAIVREAFQLA